MYLELNQGLLKLRNKTTYKLTMREREYGRGGGYESNGLVTKFRGWNLPRT